MWKPVHRAPFSDHYQVSDDGRVKRLPGQVGERYVRGGVLRPATVRGYHLVLLQHAGEKWFVRVHHLVAYAFLGTPPGAVALNGIHVNHRNGRKTDNRMENLEWATAAENEAHATANGLKARGERQHLAVLTEDKVRLARRLYGTGATIRAIAEELGCSHGAASSVLHGRTWKHVT